MITKKVALVQPIRLKVRRQVYYEEVETAIMRYPRTTPSGQPRSMADIQ